MADLPFNERPYDVFISYSHADSEIVDAVEQMLCQAKINAFLDKKNLHGGDQLSTELPNKLTNCKAAMLFISANSLKSGWVREEYSLMISQRARHSEFKIIPVTLDQSDIPEFIVATVRIALSKSDIDCDFLKEIFNALYPPILPRVQQKDVYISRTWRASENEPSNTICAAFIKSGLRLIGDSTENKIFDINDRIRMIMESCGGALFLLPHRGEGKTSPYIEIEIELARTIGLKYLLFVDDQVILKDDYVKSAINQKAYKFSEVADGSGLISHLIEDISEYYSEPLRSYSFFASSFTKPDNINEYTQSLVHQVSGLSCVNGYQLSGAYAQQEIIKRIRNASFMIADISDGNINSLIEAGIARGCGTKLFLVCQGQPVAHRFMFRDLEIFYYQDDIQLLGSIHSIAKMYKRRILNNESMYMTG